MFLWKYEPNYNSVVEMTVMRVDKGKTYKITKKVASAEKFAFWLKHYETLNIDDFKLAAKCVETEDTFLDN